MRRIVIDRCHVVTMDAARTEYSSGHVVIEGNLLVLGAQPPLELLLVDGKPVVERDELINVDETSVATEVRQASKRLLARVGE